MPRPPPCDGGSFIWISAYIERYRVLLYDRLMTSEVVGAILISCSGLTVLRSFRSPRLRRGPIAQRPLEQGLFPAIERSPNMQKPMSILVLAFLVLSNVPDDWGYLG